jgi:hypothetical protein
MVIVARTPERAASHARNLYLASCATLADLFAGDDWIGGYGYDRTPDGLFTTEGR